MDIFKNLEQNSNDSNFAIIIRHADRNQIPNGHFGNDVLLNEIGIANSILFGKKLVGRKIARIFTSPIQRCVQTAEYIAKGYGTKLDIIETTALGAPGLHIADEELAGKYYLKHGFFKILDDFRSGITSPGMTDIAEFESKMNDFISKNSNADGITIFVTHDAVISLFHYCYDQTIYTKDNWVLYLGGLTITKNNETT